SPVPSDVLPDVPCLPDCGPCWALPFPPPRLSRAVPPACRLLSELLRPRPRAGVVLAPDGSSVAIAPLLAGIEAGLRAARFGRPLPTPEWPLDPVLAVTVAEALGTSFLLARRGGDKGDNATAGVLGTGGCWDSVDNPQNYTPSSPRATVPEAVAIGAMDGAILGTRLARGLLGVLLRGYYGTGGGSSGAGWRPPSSDRRREFRALAGPERLRREVAEVLVALRAMSPVPELVRDLGTQEVAEVARRAAREFSERYVECPLIVPRCLWGARPARGSPVTLRPPLSTLVIHHTLEPSRPCRTFGHCARDMRDIQRFHQDTRGWDDIGYKSGRGWHRVGAHARGHNTRSYGVAIVGDFRATTPDRDTLGHTDCPGDALFGTCWGWRWFGGTLRRHWDLGGHWWTVRGHWRQWGRGGSGDIRTLGHTDCSGDCAFREIRGSPGSGGLLGTWGQ
uniref:Peptidoglycan recognition protein family domain-containing protein n=1 Tax=Malurus cyaneus samueli TaxID=2593467 RepID=A0A8C5X602_9PASS